MTACVLLVKSTAFDVGISTIQQRLANAALSIVSRVGFLKKKKTCDDSEFHKQRVSIDGVTAERCHSFWTIPCPIEARLQSSFVGWCFEPSQPLGVTSALMTTENIRAAKHCNISVSNIAHRHLRMCYPSPFQIPAVGSCGRRN